MSDLGAHGELVQVYDNQAIFGPKRPVARVHLVGCPQPQPLSAYGTSLSDLFPHRTGKDTSFGFPSAPSQRQGVPTILWDIWWPVDAGAKTLTISVKQSADPGASLRPRLILRGDASLGVPDDVIAVATSSLDWQTLTININPTAAGVFQVGRERRDWNLDHTIWWDNLNF